jgi:hypothetical protein
MDKWNLKVVSRIFSSSYFTTSDRCPQTRSKREFGAIHVSDFDFNKYQPEDNAETEDAVLSDLQDIQATLPVTHVTPDLPPATNPDDDQLTVSRHNCSQRLSRRRDRRVPATYQRIRQQAVPVRVEGFEAAELPHQVTGYRGQFEAHIPKTERVEPLKATEPIAMVAELKERGYRTVSASP